ncbi:MAG: 2Fe-2S iron-sulfur cluster-binding protein, partial [Pseudomonadota bacterium]
MNKPFSDARTTFRLNGADVSCVALPGERLSSVLRERLDARDVKVGCDAGDCGACTVLVEGKPVCACLTPAHQVAGRRIETQAGLRVQDPLAKALAQSFLDHGAAQCGICTPGMLVSAVALLRETSTPSETDVQDALGGVLCRCTGYRKIIDAVIGASDAPAAQGQTAESVGERLRHVDGAPKVSGALPFGDDIAPQGCLEILVIRSPFARAGFEFGDLERYARTMGLEAVLTAADIPGDNAFGVIPNFIHQPVFAEVETRFRGEAVAAVVGTPEVIAAIDPDRFPITWTEKPAAADPSAAQNGSAAELHLGHARNVMCEGFVTCGAPEDALKRAHVAVEGRFQSGFVEHAYIEPEAGFAQVVDGRL